MFGGISWKSLFVLIAILNAADAATTFWNITVNGIIAEANPILRYVIEKYGFAVTAALKIVLVPLCVVVLWISSEHLTRHRQLPKTLIIILVGVLIYAIIGNIAAAAGL